MSKFKVIFRDFRGETMLIDLCDTEEQMQRMTVLQLKQKITETDDFYAAIDMRLAFGDRELGEDSTLLSEYGITNMSTIVMITRLAGGGGGIPGTGDDGMGDKQGKNQSMEKLANFQTDSESQCALL